METSAKTAMNVNDIFLAIGKFWNFLFCFCSSHAINADGSNSYFSIFFKIH